MSRNEANLPDKKALLGPPITADYEPPELSLSVHWFHPNRPLFTLYAVDAMLQDPRVNFGLKLLRGPILADTKFRITCDWPEVKRYIITQIKRFWLFGAKIALRYMDYGYIGSEVLYRGRNGRLEFDKLKFLHPHNTRAVVRGGELLGMTVGRVRGDDSVYVGRPKLYWGVHERDQHIWYGRSRLRGAFLAWYEIWCHQGYRDMRRLWFHKNAYSGPRIQYPPGSAPLEPGATEQKSFRQYAQEVMEKLTSGGGVVYPSGGEWALEDGKSLPVPDGLLEYGDSLGDEIWEGMGIPPEVARADGTGAFAGRRIPQQAFYSSLQEIVQDLITDFDDQVLSTLVTMAFGREVDYEIECFGLLRSEDEEEQNAFQRSQRDTLTEGDQPQQPAAMGLVIDDPPPQERVTYYASKRRVA